MPHFRLKMSSPAKLAATLFSATVQEALHINDRLSTKENTWSFSQKDRAGSAQSMMTAGGQCCLAWPLPAHDACALPLSDLLLAGHLHHVPRLSFIPSPQDLPHAADLARMYGIMAGTSD